MSPKPHRRWFQFSLRSLMAASFLIALSLGWWFRPFVIETHRPDGSLRRQFTVCRDWRGGLVSHGKQAWILHDGTRIEVTSYGLSLAQDEFESLIPPAQQYEVKFEELIDLITTTIVPDSGGDMFDTLEVGSGQAVVPDGGTLP